MSDSNGQGCYSLLVPKNHTTWYIKISAQE